MPTEHADQPARRKEPRDDIVVSTRCHSIIIKCVVENRNFENFLVVGGNSHYLQCKYSYYYETTSVCDTSGYSTVLLVVGFENYWSTVLLVYWSSTVELV